MGRETFGRAFREVRVGAGYRLADVASVWGMKSLSYISDIESDRRRPPSLDMLKTVLTMFGRQREFERLARLAVGGSEGRVRIGKMSTEKQKVLVALNREGVTGQQLREVLDILRPPTGGEHRDHTTAR